MKRVPFSRGVHLLPSLFTTGNMFCSFFSIIRSINGDYYTAAWAIFVASFFDMIDGRLARMTRTQSDFGREYDSLGDLASFGLAPSILIYTWTLHPFRPIGWIFAFLFFACVALRLARFNIRIEVVEKRRFQGLPSPPAACLLAGFVMFYQRIFGTEGPTAFRSLFALVFVPLLAFLMVSHIGYRSFKEYDLGKRNSFQVLLGVAFVIGMIAVDPDIVLFSGFLAYALSGPFRAIYALIKGRRGGRGEGTPRISTRRRKLGDSLALAKPKGVISP